MPSNGKYIIRIIDEKCMTAERENKRKNRTEQNKTQAKDNEIGAPEYKI